MVSSGQADLRGLVAQVVREVIADVARTEVAGTGYVGASAPVTSGQAAVPTGPVEAARRSRSETVRITGDADLQRFTRQLLTLFENPKTRDDLRTGRLTFHLAGGSSSPAAAGSVHRIESGAVTERRVAQAADAGARIVLGPRAVLTPLGRERARALRVPIEKERR